MRAHLDRWLLGMMLLASVGLLARAADEPKAEPAKKAGDGWKDDFAPKKADLVSKGKNPYFVLEPGFVLKLKSKTGSLVIKVLEETKVVDGVETRIIEEREDENGQLKEISRNYFALDKNTLDLYYFGEDVDMYKDGKVTDHEGSWLVGVKNAKVGMMMPGKPKVGDKYYQEVAPEQAMDRAEITSVTEEIKTPAGTFKNCVRTIDTSALESGESIKVFAPDVGYVKDDEFELVEIIKPAPAK